MKNVLKTIIASFLLFISTQALAASGDLYLDSSNAWVNPGSPVNSFDTTIYARIKNLGDTDAMGTVTFTLKSSGEKIGSDQPVSVLAGSTDDVFINWLAPAGNHEIIITVNAWDASTDNPDNNSTSISFVVEQDTDKDGVSNKKDLDDDGDTVPDTEDLFPLDSKESADTDGDGIGDNADEDADNDGCNDDQDAFPSDATECLDTDDDSVGNNVDTDDDGDTIDDTSEATLGTDPLKNDTDDDLVSDKEDVFPLDKAESKDADNDGIGDNADNDDDNDEIPDSDDKLPFNPAPVLAFNDTIVKGAINQEITFDASKSYDPKDEEISFFWEIDKHTFNQPKITYTFSQTGEYEGYVKITDSEGQSKEFKFKINIYDNSMYFWLFILLIILLAIIFSIKYIFPALEKDKKEK